MKPDHFLHCCHTFAEWLKSLPENIIQMVFVPATPEFKDSLLGIPRSHIV
jgi:hypothetical protein